MRAHKVGTRDEWLLARRQLLQREKELMHLRDEDILDQLGRRDITASHSRDLRHIA